VICTLDGHQDIVKGVAFDPINKYLATQSDKSIIIWSMATWEQKYVLEEQFIKSTGSKIIKFQLTFSGNTIFYRPSWSPDGSILISGNGVKAKKHTAPLFLRNREFESEREYQGHKDTVVVAVSSVYLYSQNLEI
jgi:protein HIRA/HIR1